MGKPNEKGKKMVLGVLLNCTMELKVLLTALLVLGGIATLFQVFPSSAFIISTSDLRLCISRISSPIPNVVPPNVSLSSPLSEPPLLKPSSPPFVERDQVLENGILKREFKGYGSAAYNFITMGAYRGGLNTFAVVGLSSKPPHVYSRPSYQCEWVSGSNSSSSVTTIGKKILPDWGYGRVYTVVVVNCTFEQPINGENSGGKLILHASTSGGVDTKSNIPDRFEVLEEAPGGLDVEIFTAKPKYDYLYCGSPLYGNLSPQRVREWIVYHVELFGAKSHFVIHDAGGINEEIMEVLKPWMELGYVTLQDIREQERFDGYYHNQFLVVNDCLHRYRFMAKWMFFFDVDEYIYVKPKNTLKSVLDSLSGYSQFTIEQMPMSRELCLTADNHKVHRKWGFEKLVYRDVKKRVRKDRKYAVQPRSVFATGVHMSQNVDGKSTHITYSKIKYYHYHGTIAQRREPCRNLMNATQLEFEKNPYVLDTTLRDIAFGIKKFELKMIGTRLQNTQQ